MTSNLSFSKSLLIISFASSEKLRTTKNGEEEKIVLKIFLCPEFHLFKRWNFGGDDMQVPGCCGEALVTGSVHCIAQVVAGAEEVRNKGVPQWVWRGAVNLYLAQDVPYSPADGLRDKLIVSAAEIFPALPQAGLYIDIEFGMDFDTSEHSCFGLAVDHDFAGTDVLCSEPDNLWWPQAGIKIEHDNSPQIAA